MDEQVLARALAQAFKDTGIGASRYGTKSPATNPNFNWTHGNGGIFGVAGLEQDVISLRITPRGISQILPAFPSVYTSPLFAYVTGIESTDPVTEPTSECATCPSGEIEGCIQTAQFGRVCRETKTLDPNRAIERINRGEFDLALLNDLVGPADLFQPVRNWSRDTVLQVSTALGMLEVGVLLQNKLVPMVWGGNPANGTPPGYAEFPGLDILIGTNKQDALTGTECPSLDSDVKEFSYNLVNVTDAAGNFLIVRYLETMEAYLYHNASRQNLLPAEWVVCMRPELWYELTQIWPVAYMTTRNITLPSTTMVTMDAGTMRDMRTEMMDGMFIYLNGRRHPVILDDGITELTPTDNANVLPGEYASDIYIVPRTYLGNRPATYFEFKDYRAAGPDAEALGGRQD